MSSQLQNVWGADLMELAAPEIADVVACRKSITEKGEECGKANFEKTVG